MTNTMTIPRPDELDQFFSQCKEAAAYTYGVDVAEKLSAVATEIAAAFILYTRAHPAGEWPAERAVLKQIIPILFTRFPELARSCDLVTYLDRISEYARLRFGQNAERAVLAYIYNNDRWDWTEDMDTVVRRAIVAFTTSDNVVLFDGKELPAVIPIRTPVKPTAFEVASSIAFALASLACIGVFAALAINYWQ